MTQLNLSGNEPSNSQPGSPEPEGRSITNQTVGALGALALFAAVIVIGSCSRSSKPVAVQQPAQPAAPVAAAVAATPVPAPTPAPAKTKKRRASTLAYVNHDYGVSFRFPRKYQLKTGEALEAAEDTTWAQGTNFVRPGGATLAAVLLPETSYPGTDFEAALLHLSVNSMTADECSQFAFPETSGQGTPAQVVKAGANEFTRIAQTDVAKDETQAEYFHAFRNGTCYEFGLAVASGSSSADSKVTRVDRSAIFASLEKIVASAKLPEKTPSAGEPATTSAATSTGSAEGETLQNF